MGISPDAKRRWREGRVGTVPAASPRGVLALILLALCLLAAFSGIIVQVVDALGEGEPPEQPPLTHEGLVVTLIFNVLVLMLLPMLAIIVSRPGEPGAIVRRLRLEVRLATAAHAAIAVGVTLASLVLLGLIVTGLQKAGLDAIAQESGLVPQIQALLNWPVVIGLSAIAAVTEEVFFRGLLQPRIGLLASSALFGLIHIGYGTILQVVAPFLLGLLFGYLYDRTRSLWTPIVAHFTFDFLQLSVLLLEKQGVLQS